MNIAYIHKNMKGKIFILMMALLTMTFTSCKDEDEPGTIPSDAMLDMATFVSQDGNGSTFTLQKDGDSPVVTLTARQRLDTDLFTIGNRLLIYYVPESGVAYQSGPAVLYAARQVINGKALTGNSKDYPGWSTEATNLQSIWRTGKYLNIHSLAYYKVNPKRFVLVADETTIDDEYPDLYLIFYSDDQVDGDLNTLYASFDISGVWDSDTCKGVRVHLANSSGENHFTFNK